MDAKQLYDLKQKAMHYYLDNGVPQKMEEILNSMFYDNPEDVYGYLVNYFEQFTKLPVISKLNARKGFDGKGQPTILIEVHCKIKTKEQLICRCISPSSNSHLLDNAKLSDREAEEQRRAESVRIAIGYINQEFSPMFRDMKPTEQTKVDAVISEYMQKLQDEEDAKWRVEVQTPDSETSPRLDIPQDRKSKSKSSVRVGKQKIPTPVIIEEPHECLTLGAEAACAVSQVVCTAGAAIQGVPLYEYISSLYNTEQCQFQMPLPMVSIMQSGKAAAGKLNCIKEFLVVPSPHLSYTQSLDYITGIYSYVEKSLVSKFGAHMKAVSDTGALCPVFDKLELGLDLLIEAIIAANLKPGEDFHIGINAAAHEIMDFEKGKYEVIAGNFKGADDMVGFWTELISRYPAIKFIIDPFRKQERSQWLELCDKITDTCFVVGENLYPRTGHLKNEELPNPVITNATVLAMESLTSVSELMTCVKKMEDAKNQIVLAARAGETQDDFLADLAVGMNVRFIKLGAPNRGERISKYNRLLQIESELKSAGKLAPQKDHEFIHISSPPPPPEVE